MSGKLTKARVLYFGCIGRPGHFMHKSGGTRDWDAITPWGKTPDGTLCLKDDGRQPQGEALLHHKDGWTALSFWDRSVDKRGGCNSNFFANGDFTFDEMLMLARLRFPEVIARLTFPITDAGRRALKEGTAK